MVGNSTGKSLMFIGAFILLAGVIWYFLGDKLRWIGHLPGDINIEREKFKFYFPVATLILLNLLIFIIIRVWNWISNS
ncbi:DUF2905 domain-containing protein [Mucilaginibacter sp. PAMB04168]|uniref:DUF2905 domain-containing protein n=1 Tax=Mucilaginibacter sp. PAMB04168 TaxID=3138567 RepID=UPI0031F632D4